MGQNLSRILGKSRKLLQSQKKTGSIIFPKYLTPKLTTNSASDTFCEGDTGEDCESATVEEEFDVFGDVYFESLEGDITEAEVYTAVRALKNGKAAGPDGIIGEFFKHSAIFCCAIFSKNSLIDYLQQGQKQLLVRSNYSPAAEKKGDANNPELGQKQLLPRAWSEAIIHPLLKKRRR